jgi:hypothetical protein
MRYDSKDFKIRGLITPTLKDLGSIKCFFQPKIECLDTLFSLKRDEKARIFEE